MRRSRVRTPGFTLIELLIVIIVLAVLAAIAIPRFFGTKERALVATLRSDLRNMTNAQAAYWDDNQTYAATVDDLAGFFTPSERVSIVIDSASVTGWGATASHPAARPVCTVAVGDNQASTPQCAQP